MDKAKRNVSLDLLRCLAMLMVVVLHATNRNPDYGLGHVEFTSVLQPGSLFAFFINSFSLVAVNCFVLISGYFMCESKFNCKRAIKIWLTVFIYSFGLYFLLCLVPFTSNAFSFKNIVTSIFPISRKQYWFATMYFLLLLFSPFINILIKALSEKEHRYLVILSLGVFSLITTVFGDNFGSESGYSFIWFVVLYLTAAYIRKYPLPQLKYGLFYIVSCLAVFAACVIGAVTEKTHHIVSTVLNNFSSYNCAFVFLAAVCLFMFFKNHPINGDSKISKLIVRIAPYTFGVYLLHDNRYMRPIIWQKIVCLKNYSDSDIKLIGIMLASVAVIFIVGVAVNYIWSKMLNLIIATAEKSINKKES